MKPTLEVVTLVISITTFFGGLVMWYGGAVRKTYAAQRDYDHLKNSYKQLSASVDSLAKEVDNRFDQTILEMKELKGLTTAVLVKVTPGDNSAGWYKRSQEQR